MRLRRQNWCKKRDVAVLGCGPAGLFAAHALVLVGHRVTILSNKQQSTMFGAQYLHAPVPGLSGREFKVDYVLKGTPEEYARKVYGDAVSAGETSAATLVGQHDAWDIRAAYYRAWNKYEDRIEDTPEMGPGDVSRISAKFNGYVISSIPANNICKDLAHRFSARFIWAVGDAPELGVEVPFRVPNNSVLCNGCPSPSWYRASTILGYSTVEWPNDHKPPIPGVAKVRKPIDTNCDCFPEVVRVGRYGKWSKGVLAHQAYYDIAELAS